MEELKTCRTKLLKFDETKIRIYHPVDVAFMLDISEIQCQQWIHFYADSNDYVLQEDGLRWLTHSGVIALACSKYPRSAESRENTINRAYAYLIDDLHGKGR